MAGLPDKPLQEAVFAALKASSAVSTLVGSKGVYDSVPKPKTGETEEAYQRRVPMPYVTIGDDDIVDDSTGCFAAWDCEVTVHVWSRKVGKTEAKSVGGAVYDALNVELVIAGFVCTEFEFRDAIYFADPDGVTTHGVIKFRYLIDL